jgi:hypothetical protein
MSNNTISNKKTPVEWLVEQVNADCLNSTFIKPELVEQARKMEREQRTSQESGLKLIPSQYMPKVFDNGNMLMLETPHKISIKLSSATISDSGDSIKIETKFAVIYLSKAINHVVTLIL